VPVSQAATGTALGEAARFSEPMGGRSLLSTSISVSRGRCRVSGYRRGTHLNHTHQLRGLRAALGRRLYGEGNLKDRLVTPTVNDPLPGEGREDQRAAATASRNHPVCGIHCSAQRQASPSGASGGGKALSSSSAYPDVMPLTISPGRLWKSEE
jgi:hypothetical protein